MGHRTGFQRTLTAVSFLAVALTGCGAKSDGTTSTETTLAESPLCATLESNLEGIQVENPMVATEVDGFRLRAQSPSYPEWQIAEWFCEMSERFPAQMNYSDLYDRQTLQNNGQMLQPLGWRLGANFLLAQFGQLKNYNDIIFERPWGNPNTYADDVFPGCEPGLGLRTTELPGGILTKFPPGNNLDLSIPKVLTNTVASGSIRALKNGTFSEYRRAVAEEWKLTFASELLYPPYRNDPPAGTTQIGYLSERYEARTIDAGNLLYIKFACPEIWADLDAGPDGISSYLDSLSLDLAKPELKWIDQWSWPTHRGVNWSASYEGDIYTLTGCNFERLTLTSTLKTDAPEEQGYLGFECGLDPDAASWTLRSSKYFAGPSFVYAYNEPASRDVAVQRHRASDYNFEYGVAFCGQVSYHNNFLPFVAYYKSADVVKKWQINHWTSKEGMGLSAEEITELIKKYDFREC